MRNFFLLYPLACLSLYQGLQQDPALTGSMERGRAIFVEFCVTCHQAGGEGVEEVYPPLAGSDYLLGKREASIRGVKYGQRGPMVVNGVPYDNTMMPLGLSDQEIADVMNYVRNSWGNQAEGPPVTPEEVAAIGPR